MASSDAFALKNSGLNEFLFAEVGSEINGSPLTILSVLARLGKDPWAEAARWARSPKSSTIDDLANSISQMPLCQQALLDARSTAARLILLLPSQAQSISERIALPIRNPAVPRWLPLAALFGLLACGIAFEMMASTPPAEPARSAASLVEHPRTPD